MKNQQPTIKANHLKKILLAFLITFFIISSFFIARFIFSSLKKATSVDPTLISELTPRIDIASVKKATQILEQKTSNLPVSKPQPQIPQTPSPTSTTQESFPQNNKKSFQAQIINGSSKTTAAQDVAQKLESLGYNIKNISQADRQDYSSTTIRLKNEAEGNYEEIKQALYPTFANFVKESLTDQSTVDIVIILGQ